jgi:hypothetical protein
LGFAALAAVVAARVTLRVAGLPAFPNGALAALDAGSAQRSGTFVPSQSAFVLTGADARTVDASLIPAALSDSAPFFAGIAVIVAALLPAVARTFPLVVVRTLVGAGRTKRIIGISKYDQYFSMTIRII